MKQLSIDSSNQALSIAVLEDMEVLGQVCLTIKKNHSITLMPTIDFLIKSLDLVPGDLERIIVAQGPGSYTGVRIAVATAKTLAATLNIDLIGMSSLLSLVPESVSGLVVPLINARRNHVYAAYYKQDRLQMPEAYQSIEEVLDQVSDESHVTFVGETEAFEEMIQSLRPDAVIQSSLPDAGRLAQLASGKPAEAVHSFEPNYLKRVEAEEHWLKGHQEDGRTYIKRL